MTRGAAVVEFVMISVLLIFLLFAVLQVAVLFYVRNIVAASAADGARYAATSNVAAEAGGGRATSADRRRVDRRSAHDVPCAGSVGVDARADCRPPSCTARDGSSRSSCRSARSCTSTSPPGR